MGFIESISILFILSIIAGMIYLFGRGVKALERIAAKMKDYSDQ